MSGLFLFAFPFLILGIVWFFVWLTVRENRKAAGTRADIHPVEFDSELGRPYATVAIIALNLFVYAVAGYEGAGWMKVPAPTLFEMGGNLAPATATGEWRRLFIAMFLHGGFMHVTFNMLALWEAGRVSERLMGRWRYVLLYLVAGVTGNLFSINWRQDTVSVGASGAVFGVYGGLIAALLFERGLLPPGETQRLRAGAIAFVLYSLVSGFFAEHVDNAAHIGGLLAGTVLGTAFFASAGRAWTLSVSMACILAFSMARAAVLAEPIRDEIPFRDFMASFPPEERRLNELHNKLLTDGKAGVLSVQEFAASLDREVIPGWHRQERKIEELRRVGERSRKIREPMSKFIRLRRQSMELLREAMRRQDAVLLNRYNAMVGEANAVLKELNEASSAAKSADS